MSNVNKDILAFIEETIENFQTKHQPSNVGKSWDTMSFEQKLKSRYELTSVSELLIYPLDIYLRSTHSTNSEPARFSAGEGYLFNENVRMVTFLHLYNSSIRELYGDVEITLQNGIVCTLAMFMDSLYELHKIKKSSNYSKRIVGLYKGVINSLCAVLSKFIEDYNPNEVVKLSKRRVINLAKHIDDNGGVILNINVDGIIYIARKPLLPDWLTGYHADVLDWVTVLPQFRYVYSQHGVIKTRGIINASNRTFDRINKMNTFKKYSES